MAIQGYDIYRYTLPLKQPLNVGGQPLAQREGLLLRLQGVSDTEGWGEVAPLPGFSPETIEVAQAQLALVADALEEQSLDLDAVLMGDLVPADTAPSVRFGVETAYLSLLEKAGGVAWSGTGGSTRTVG